MKREPGTFFTVPKSVIPHLPSLQRSDLAIYFSLCARINGETGVCYPAQSTIAAECGLAVRTVGAAVAKLEQLGLILVERRPHRTSIYEVLYLRVGHPGVGSSSLVQSETDSLIGSGLPHEVGWTGSRLQEGAQPTADKREHLTRSIKDTPFISEEEQSRRGRQPPLVHTNAFRRWLAVYPRKEAPGNALRAFQQAIFSLVHHQTVIEHPEITNTEQAVEFLIDQARAYADAMSKIDPKYVLGPARWLRDECFDNNYLDNSSAQPTLATEDELMAAGYPSIDDYNQNG